MPLVDTISPYSKWKTHRGHVAEALALLQTETGKHYTALVVHYDGFFVVPQAAWNAQLAHQKLNVLVTSAENEESVGPFPIVVALRRETKRSDYRLLKINDHHLRSLPLLNSGFLTEGTRLTVH